MATTQVEVVSPARILYTGEAEMVVCRSVDGEIAFLAGHIPYLGALDPCVTRLVAENGDETKIAVSGGFVEVRDSRVVILADQAELAADVDVEAAHAARRDAQQRAAAAGSDEAVAALAELDLRRAEVRLEAAGVAVD